MASVHAIVLVETLIERYGILCQFQSHEAWGKHVALLWVGHEGSEESIIQSPLGVGDSEWRVTGYPPLLLVHNFAYGARSVHQGAPTEEGQIGWNPASTSERREEEL